MTSLPWNNLFFNRNQAALTLSGATREKRKYAVFLVLVLILVDSNPVLYLAKLKNFQSSSLNQELCCVRRTFEAIPDKQLKDSIIVSQGPI